MLMTRWEKNRISQMLSRGGSVLGARSGIGSRFVVELAARLKFDFLVLDGWSPELTMRRLDELLSAAEALDLPTAVRLREARSSSIHQVLDMGACGVQIAARSREEAELVLESIRYPPRGQRPASDFARGRSSLAGNSLNLPEAREQVVFILEIGSFEGVQNLEDMLAVGGIDAVHIDLLNLCIGMGHAKTEDAPVQEIVRFLVQSCGREGVAVGLTRTPSLLEPPPAWSNYLLLPVEQVVERAMDRTQISAKGEENKPC